MLRRTESTGFHGQQCLSDKHFNEAAPKEQVVKLRALETMEKLADGKATKIIIPSEIQSLAGLAASARVGWEAGDDVFYSGETDRYRGSNFSGRASVNEE